MQKKKTSGVAQVVEHLPSKCKAEFKPQYCKKKKKKYVLYIITISSRCPFPANVSTHKHTANSCDRAKHSRCSAQNRNLSIRVITSCVLISQTLSY
jgi:hypothetical protein